jgi:hypothetical protein
LIADCPLPIADCRLKQKHRRQAMMLLLFANLESITLLG